MTATTLLALLQQKLAPTTPNEKPSTQRKMIRPRSLLGNDNGSTHEPMYGGHDDDWRQK